MISRNYIACETCDQNHILRIQVGRHEFQDHTFDCTNCGEEIKVRMHCYKETASTSLELLENCKQSEYNEGNVINLSPDFLIKEGDAHLDDIFPAIELIRSLPKATESPSFKSVEEMTEFYKNYKSLPQLWKTVKKGWTLTKSGNEKLAKTILSEYKPDGYEGPPKLNHVVFDFCSRICHPLRHDIFESIGLEAESARKNHEEEYKNLIDYIKTELKNESMEKYLEIFKEYFSAFDDFEQTLVYAQYNIALSDNQKATSCNFSKTKQFYGNAFETLTSNLTTLACLNNVANGRSYDKFERMNLKQYKKLDKASRIGPLKSNAQLAIFESCLKSEIRNASHHSSMKYSKGLITYRSGGNGAERTINYSEYLLLCNEIIIFISSLLKLELAMTFE